MSDESAEPNPSVVGHRIRASKLRKKLNAGKPISSPDAQWLQLYDSQITAREIERSMPPAAPDLITTAAAAGIDVGASESDRTVKFELKEKAKSIGTGEAALAAAATANANALALISREDGRLGLAALKEAVEVYKSVAADLQGAMRDILQASVDERAAYRENFMRGVILEGQIKTLTREREDGGDPLDALMAAMAGKYMGIDPRELQAAGQLAKGIAGTNGHPRPKKS